jgi:hypothetical protein
MTIRLGTTVRLTLSSSPCFDEFGIEGCERAPKHRTYDATGRSEITTVSARLLKKRNGTGRVKASI